MSEQTAATVPFRLSAHLGYLFDNLPLAERFTAAHEAGFRAIEIPDPYSLSPAQFRLLCERNDLEVAQIALPNDLSGVAAKGFAALPGYEAAFEDALRQAISYANAVKCRLIHPMSGIKTAVEAPHDDQVYLANLAKACRVAASDGIGVIIEAISALGTEDYFLNSLHEACAVVETVQAPNLMLSLDTYHACAMDVDIPTFIARHCAIIAHVQIADWPERTEPGSGQVEFDALFRALCTHHYQGYIGLEYRPSAKGESNFAWVGSHNGLLEPLRTASPPGP